MITPIFIPTTHSQLSGAESVFVALPLLIISLPFVVFIFAMVLDIFGMIGHNTLENVMKYSLLSGIGLIGIMIVVFLGYYIHLLIGE